MSTAFDLVRQQITEELALIPNLTTYDIKKVNLTDNKITVIFDLVVDEDLNYMGLVTPTIQGVD